VDQARQEKEARQFLRTGLKGDLSESDLALACDRLLQATARQSFTRAVDEARRYIAYASKMGGQLHLSATRCLARYLHLSGQHKEALPLYLKARERAKGDAITRARIDRVLIDVHMYLGDYESARKAARRAIATFSRAGAERDLAQTRANFGNLLHRQDKHRDAERIYRQAAEYFEKTGDNISLARCYYNRANTLVQLFEIEEAESLYKKARKMYTADGFDLDACDVSYGLAWLWMLTGRFHRALVQLTNCQEQYRRGGDRRGEALCTLDRAETFLSLGLYSDALDAARLAGRKFKRLNLRYERSKSALFRAQAAIAMNRRSEATKAHGEARSGFRAERNSGFEHAASMIESDLIPPSGSSRGKTTRVRRQKRRQLAYWDAVSDLKTVARGASNGDALRRLAGNSAVMYVPHLYALWQTLQGDDHFQKGHHDDACRCWQRAADRLDAVRSHLPPMELRSAYALAHERPHGRLVRAFLVRDPLWSAVWSERSRTAGIWAPIDWDASARGRRKKVQESLSALADRVALLSHEISSGARASTIAERTPASLQKQVREQLLEIERHEQDLDRSNEELADGIRLLSFDQPIVQFHLGEEDITAFVHRDGRTDSITLSGGRPRLQSAFQRWRFFLDRDMTLGNGHRNASRRAERTLWSELGDWLWRPLRIDPGNSRVLIIPEGELANVPWSALEVDGHALAETYAFVISPSLRHHLAARRVRTRSSRVSIFRGKSDGLPATEIETGALMTRAGTNAALYYPCHRDDWPMTGASDIWHYSGHAVVRQDNPFYSFLSLEDGPLFAADFRLRSCRVNLVTLAACRSGEHFAVPGAEATGLVRSLLEMGARNVIAGYWPLADESTSLWMRSFYDRYFEGESLLESAREAALSVREVYPASYHWAAFSVTGAGDTGGGHVQ
jgi:tetratricopeptide (TPR) repeat protein